MAVARSLACVAAALALALGGAAGAQPRSRLAPGLEARAAERGSVRVIVELDVDAQPEGRLVGAATRRAQRERIAAAQDALRRELAGTSHAEARIFRSIPFAALEVGPAALARLARARGVVAVQEDHLHRPDLDVSVPRVEADQTAALGFDGNGQAVAVLDTGADVAHPNLQGKLVAEACFASGPTLFDSAGSCPNGLATQLGPGSGTYCTYSSSCFHGTHVAGIAVGSGPAYPGVARGASLVPIQVFSRVTGSSCGGGASPCALSWSSDQIAAMEYILDTLDPDPGLPPIASVNMSLGGSVYSDQASCDAANAATKAAIDNLRSVDIATAIAAGNDGYYNAISAPGCISTAVSVSAVDDNDAIPYFANAASFLDLWAPGVSIRAPLYQSTGYTNASGTSMATPHVAGAWAILRQVAPGASVDEVLFALQTTGVFIPDIEAQTTRIRILQASAALVPACSNGQDDDGDGLADYLGDPGCASSSDASEHDAALACDNGLDDDGDGLADYPADPGCGSLLWGRENPQCDDGLDNDGDGRIDWDGPLPDAQCIGRPYGLAEAHAASACGLGFELALALPALAWLRQRRRRRA